MKLTPFDSTEIGLVSKIKNVFRKSPEEAIKEVIPEKIPSSNKTDLNSFSKSIINGDSNADRSILPSRGFFYDNQTDVTFRTFKVLDLKKIQRFIVTDNISHLIDTVQNCITSETDVRKLTVGDFLFVLFQIIFNSYPKPIYPIRWTSFYGNPNEVQVTLGSLNVTELNIQRFTSELPNYKDYKFTPLLVEAWEYLYSYRYRKGDSDQSRWTEDQTWFYEEIACYLDAASPEAQLARAEEMSTKSEEFAKLKLFKSLIEHSVQQHIEVRDVAFEPNRALEQLTARKETVQQMREESPSMYSELVSQDDSMNLIKIELEINRISKALVGGEKVEPIKETVFVPFDLPSLTSPLFN